MGLLRTGVRRSRLTLCLSFYLFVLTGKASALQEAAEEEAFAAARAQTEPAARASALELYLHRFPAGSRADAASRLLLESYLDALPDPDALPNRVAAIHTVAAARVAAASAGPERWLEEARVADQLANAGDNGVDLTDAQRWAADAVQSMTEPAYRQQSTRLQLRYKLPRPSPGELRKQFAGDRATALAALANVHLRQRQFASAATLLIEARRLDPLNGEGLSLSGQLALQDNKPQQAFTDLVRASAVTPLAPRWQAQLQILFAGQEHTAGDTLEGRIDEAYRALHPAVFTLPRRKLPSTGHPALLELFTGSDCAPCAGPDLAIDSLLGSYARTDLIALEYDEHIPRPDPLANTATVERAGFYAVDATPAAFLDGQPVPLLGSRRSDVENIVLGLGDQIEEAAGLRSALRLTLTATPAATPAAAPGTDGEIETTATLAVDHAPLAAESTTGEVSLRSLARMVLCVALAEDNIRYMGQNGVRFHRMVVRALRQTPASSLLGSPAQTARSAFRPAALAREQAAYLTDFQTRNDRFGSFRFRTTEIPIHTGQLVVVAWVQDPVSRRVLQSTFAPVPAP